MSIDIEQLAKELDFEVDDVLMLFSVFFETLHKSLEEIFEGIEENDFETIRTRAHSIKGSAANLLLKDISNSAYYMEKSAINHEPIEYKNYALEIKSAVEKIEKELNYFNH